MRLSLNELIDLIQENGELEKYWVVVEKENEAARRNARKQSRDRKRLEMGSDYESSGHEDEEAHSAESDYGEEEDSNPSDTLGESGEYSGAEVSSYEEGDS